MTQVAPAPERAAVRQALAGVRVVELGFAAAGPLVGKYLANHGAEVIHVESRTAPDMFRTAYPPFKDNVPGLDRAAMFAFYNDGKRGITLNLKHPRAVELARALIARSDVLIESFPAGTLARRGLAPEELRAASPRLIVLSSCNQGQTGPHAKHPGYGSQLSALAGFVHLLGDPAGSPLILYGPYIDYIAVGYGVIAALAALARRCRTGEGCTIDLSQYEAGLQFLAPALLEHQANGGVPTRQGNGDAVAAPHGVYPCAGDDRWAALSVWDDDEWRRFAAVTGLGDARFTTAEARRTYAAELERRIGDWTRTRSREEVVAALRARGLRAAEVRTIGELFDDPQLSHRGFWRSLPHAVIGAVRCLGAPFTLSDTPGAQERAGPLIGQDNAYVFGDVLGLGAKEIAELSAQGVFE